MAFENRNGRKFYYRKKRIGKKVISEYVGTGIYADLASDFDFQQRMEKKLEFEKEKEARKAIEQQFNEIDELHQKNKALVNYVLIAIGFYRHRGEWRKMKKLSTTDKKMSMRKLSGKTRDELSLEEKDFIQEWFESNPEQAEKFGNVSTHSIQQWSISFGEQPMLDGAIKAQVIHLMQDLGLETANPLEKILIQEIAVCWLKLNYFSLNLRSKVEKQHSPEHGLYWAKQNDIAQKQFTRAVTSFAKVRKLLLEANAKGSEIVKNLMEAKASQS